MKKIISMMLIVLLILAGGLTGCGGGSSTDNGGNEDSTTSSEVSEENNKDGDSPQNGAAGMGDLLSNTYIEMMKKDQYMMSYKTSSEFDGDSMEFEVTIAVSGDNTAMLSESDDMVSKVVSKGDKTYMIDDETRMVIVVPGGSVETEPVDFEEEGIVYVGNGVENGLAYEEYTTEDTNIKYYFDGKKLVQMAVTVEGETILLEDVEMSDKVPADLFDIPSDYEVTGM